MQRYVFLLHLLITASIQMALAEFEEPRVILTNSTEALMSEKNFVELSSITHKIPPGYRPEKSSDEVGLWMDIDDYEKQIRSSPLRVLDRELVNYISDIACRVAGPYCSDIRVYIIRNPGFNASMTASGVLQIWTGLILRSSSEDEIAAVIAHEIAHYTLTHTLDRVRRIRKAMTGGSIASIGIGVLTGVFLPIGESVAVSNAMAFSRLHESEADILGVKLMLEAGYNPNSSWSVWENVIIEEQYAAIKSEKPTIFSKTHPDPELRIGALKKWVGNNFNSAQITQTVSHRHLEMLQKHYVMFMEDQIDTNRYGRTEAIINKHQEMGLDRNLIAFFRGEMYRQRSAEYDTTLAEQSYLDALSGSNPYPEAFLNLGYLYYKQQKLNKAKNHFKQYLQLKPEASDREMIEFYLEEINT